MLDLGVDRTEQLRFVRRVLVGYFTVKLPISDWYGNTKSAIVMEHPDAQLRSFDAALVDLILCDPAGRERHEILESAITQLSAALANDRTGKSRFEILESVAVRFMTMAEEARKLES